MLGPGGFGITYLARSLRLDRDVAIKEYFPAEFAYRDGPSTVRSSTSGRSQSDFFAQGKRHFIEEARVLGKFRHPHIVRVIGLIEANNTAYMVLEFEEGQSFKHWLRELGRPPTQAEIDRILTPLLSALEAIHDKGIFHRDIAPDNIIIRPNGDPVLIDFGAARQFARENSHTLGAIVKHGYSPPEQYTLDTRLQGAWSDIYALSATMFHAIMGEPPEEASKRQLQDTMLPVEAHMDALRRSLYRPGFIAAINAGLVLRPSERPATVRALRAILGDGGNGQPAPANTVITRQGIARPDPALAAERQSNPLRGPAAGTGTSATRVGTAPGVAALASSGSGLAERLWAWGLIAGSGAIALAAIAAALFLMLGGTYHPMGLTAAAGICAGLLAACLERTAALMQAHGPGRPGAATSTAVVCALVLAVFWLPFALYPLSGLLLAVAAAYAVLRFGAWVPGSLLLLAGLHLALALWMLLGTFEFEPRADGALPSPFFWPLMATSLAAVSLLAVASAFQMRRHAAAQAA